MTLLIAALVVVLPLAGAVVEHNSVVAAQPTQFAHYDFR